VSFAIKSRQHAALLVGVTIVLISVCTVVYCSVLFFLHQERAVQYTLASKHTTVSGTFVVIWFCLMWTAIASIICHYLCQMFCHCFRVYQYLFTVRTYFSFSIHWIKLNFGKGRVKENSKTFDFGFRPILRPNFIW